MTIENGMLKYGSESNSSRVNNSIPNFLHGVCRSANERKGDRSMEKYIREPDCLGNMVIILSNQLKHYLHRAAEEEGISGSQSRILHFLALESEERDVYQKDVEDFFCLRRSTVTQNLQSMEKNGLITRSSVTSDARLKKLVLTEQGMELERRIHNRVQDMERMLSEDLTRAEREEFQSVLIKMSRKMETLGMNGKGEKCGC